MCKCVRLQHYRKPDFICINNKKKTAKYPFLTSQTGELFMSFSLTVRSVQNKPPTPTYSSENESRAAANLTGFRRVTQTANLSGPEHMKYMKLAAGKTAYMTHQALWKLKQKMMQQRGKFLKYFVQSIFNTGLQIKQP